MVHRLAALAPVIFASISFVTLPMAHAEGVKLPTTMAFTAYDTGTAGFNISVAVGEMMKDKYGTDVRVLPAGDAEGDHRRLPALRRLVVDDGAGERVADGIGAMDAVGQHERARHHLDDVALACKIAGEHSLLAEPLRASPHDPAIYSAARNKIPLAEQGTSGNLRPQPKAEGVRPS